MTWIILYTASMALWLAVLVLPWRPWRTAEALDAASASCRDDLSDVVVLIPARNEAQVLPHTLRALANQGPGIKIVVIDDQSRDGTAETVHAMGLADVIVMDGSALPPGWTGKLWALEQGGAQADRRLTLLLDADIALAPGTVAALRRKIDHEGVALASLMAAPPLDGLWERLLLPAYIYFFKLLYPFRLSNAGRHGVAAAAGGCVLLETRALSQIGGFAAIRDELIDDCALARRVQGAGYRTWIGLTHSATMLRRQRLGDIWNMIARTAFTQLRYSVLWLALCTVLLALAFWMPAAGLAVARGPAQAAALVAYGAMAASFRPTLRYYRLSWWWALLLPLTGTLYLAMTWTSAVRYWAGHRSRWKDRTYSRLPDSGAQG